MSAEQPKKEQEREDLRPESDGSESYRFLNQKIKKRPINKKQWLMRVLGVILAGVAVGLIASFVFSLMHPEVTRPGETPASEAKITIPEDEEPTSVSLSSASDSEGEEAETSPSATSTSVTSASATSESTESASTEEGTSAISTSQETEGETTSENTESTSAESASAESTSAESDVPEGMEDDPNAETGTENDPEQEKPATEVIPIPGLTLDQYKEIHQEMMWVAEEAERGMVQVIGITNEMDYFDQGYENQRRVAGTIVARNDTDLFILTEYRVVDQVERIQILFCDGTMRDATFQRSDPETGLAILKLPLDSLTEDEEIGPQVARLGNSFQLRRGDPVMAIGSPMGYTDSFAQGIVTSTTSRASVVDREYRLLTTDMHDVGDGSGVLINLSGEVVGVLTHSFDTENDALSALGISQVKELIQDLSNNEAQTYIGVYGQDVTAEITDRTGIPRGVLITEVVLDSPASLAGIKEYDVIVRIGENSIETMRDFHRHVDVLPPDEPITITAMRRGAEGFAEVDFTVTPEAR